MAIKSDKWIERMCVEKQMIFPYAKQTKEQGGEKLVSYGVSSYGYDIRCSRKFKVFDNPLGVIIDPKDFNTDVNFRDVESTDYVLIPPRSFALTQSVEYFKIPRNVLGVCVGKSTYARCGLIVNVTPLEPEWEGYLTIEISNTTPLPVKVYTLEGIAQLLFMAASNNDICKISYADKNGKYQKQVGITGAKV